MTYPKEFVDRIAEIRSRGWHENEVFEAYRDGEEGSPFWLLVPGTKKELSEQEFEVNISLFRRAIIEVYLHLKDEENAATETVKNTLEQRVEISYGLTWESPVFNHLMKNQIAIMGALHHLLKTKKGS
jgi:hypothetical protein